MIKRIITTAAAAALVASLAVMPVHAASFSDSNIVYTDIGGVQQKWDSNFNVQESVVYSTNRYSLVDLKRSAGQELSQLKKLVRVNCDYGPGAGDYDGDVNYAHSRFYLALNNNSYDQPANLSIALNYDTGSNDGRIIKVFGLENSTNAFYASGSESESTMLRYNAEGGGPWTVRSNAGDWIWHQFDLIVDVNGGKSGMVYGFIDGKLYGYTKVNENRLDNDKNKIYHGYTIAADAGSFTKTNDEVIFRLSDDNVRSTIYANTSDYKVTLEDVINSQGLSDDISGIDNAIMRTSDLETYMPGSDSFAYNNSDAAEEHRIQTNVTYNADKTVATVAQYTAEKAYAASMSKGGYPVTGSNGIGYSSYANTARFIRLSFDQQIEKGTIEYGISNGNYKRGISFWSNDGYLVVSAQGNSEYEGNQTLSNVGYNDKAHIDWLIDTVEKKQYLFVNKKHVNSGSVDISRINDIQIQTTGDASVDISDWSMTLYNNDASYESVKAQITDGSGNVDWDDEKLTYEITDEMEGSKIAVSVAANNIEDYMPNDDTKIITAIYDEDDRLLALEVNPYVSGQTIADETITNVFDYTEDMKTIRAFVWDVSDTEMTPQTAAVRLVIE